MSELNKNYYYPAIFTTENEGFSVNFPDLPGCYTEGDTLDEAYKMATSAIGLYLQSQDGSFAFPKTTSPHNIKLDDDQFLVLIEFDPVEYLKNTSNKTVRKTLTIPSWLNSLAEQNNINFSNVLQNALKEYLNINK